MSHQASKSMMKKYWWRGLMKDERGLEVLVVGFCVRKYTVFRKGRLLEVIEMQCDGRLNASDSEGLYAPDSYQGDAGLQVARVGWAMGFDWERSWIWRKTAYNNGSGRQS